MLMRSVMQCSRDSPTEVRMLSRASSPLSVYTLTLWRAQWRASEMFYTHTHTHIKQTTSTHAYTSSFSHYVNCIETCLLP